MVRSVSKSGQNGLRAIQEAIIDGQGDILNNAPAVSSEKEREVLIESQRHLLPACVANKAGGSPSARRMVGTKPESRTSNAKTSM